MSKYQNPELQDGIVLRFRRLPLAACKPYVAREKPSQLITQRANQNISGLRKNADVLLKFPTACRIAVIFLQRINYLYVIDRFLNNCEMTKENPIGLAELIEQVKRELLLPTSDQETDVPLLSVDKVELELQLTYSPA